MKVWYFAHLITLLSLTIAIWSALYIDYVLIVQLVATVFIFQSAERIREREKWRER